MSFIMDNDALVSEAKKFWSVVGCSHYHAAASVIVGSPVTIRRHPIPEHPWNIAVFNQSGEQIGTLTRGRIGRIYERFPEQEDLRGRVEFLGFAKYGLLPNIMKIKVIL
jgi:hypothetical protein